MSMNTRVTKGNKNNFHSIILYSFRPIQVPVYSRASVMVNWQGGG